MSTIVRWLIGFPRFEIRKLSLVFQLPWIIDLHGSSRCRLGWMTIVLLLSACSFEFSPIYAHKQEESASLRDPLTLIPQVRIDNIPNREGQLMRRALSRYLHAGRPVMDAPLIFHVELRWRIESRGHELTLAKQSTVTVLEASYWLSSSDDPDSRLNWSQGMERLTQSVFFVFDDFAELSAQREVRAQLVERMARRLRDRLIFLKNRWPSGFSFPERVDQGLWDSSETLESFMPSQIVAE